MVLGQAFFFCVELGEPMRGVHLSLTHFMSQPVFFGLLASAVYVVLSFRKSKSSKKMSSVECTHEGGDCGHVTAAPAWRGPVAPKSGPVPKELAAGEQAWLCTCGESKNYPFCDGSHRQFNAANNTTFAPRPYKNVRFHLSAFYATGERVDWPYFLYAFLSRD